MNLIGTPYVLDEKEKQITTVLKEEDFDSHEYSIACWGRSKRTSC